MKKILSSLSALLLFVLAANAQLAVNTTQTATQLAQILAGSGVAVSNAALNCGANGAGSFTNGNTTNLGINSGIVLTTGNATSIPQAATAFASTDNSNTGDADLNLISNAATQDKCLLTFDIVPAGNSLSFQYVFGSEEYPEFVCSQFNDVFGFFVTGPNPGGGAYTTANIAFIPGTNTTVSINTVNSGTPGSGYTAAGCQSLAYSGFYVNNTASTIVYDGFTTVFTASIAVVPCATYSFKLAIADAGDGVYDSGVFIQSNSFSSVGTTVAASYDPGFTNAFEGCTNGYFTITLPQPATTSAVINYTLTGTAQNGTDYVSLPGTAVVNPGSTTTVVTVQPLADGSTEGLESVTMNLTNPCDGSILTSATLNINDVTNTTATATPSSICAGQNVQLNATGQGTYSWSATSGTVSNPAIANPTAQPSQNTTYTVTTTFGSCVSTASTSVNVTSVSLTSAISPTTAVCPGTTVNLSSQLTGGTGAITYGWSGGTVASPNTQNTTATPGATTTYTVTASDANGCTASSTVTANVNPAPQPSLGANQNYCPDVATSATLTPAGGPYQSYSWTPASTDPSITVTTSGTYSVTVTDANTCTGSSSVVVTFYPQTQAPLNDGAICLGQSVTLNTVGGLSNVLWSNGSNATSITVSTPGDYSYTATDGNGCPVVSDTSSIGSGTPPVVNLTAAPDTICAGASTTLNANASGNSITYLWSPGNETTATISASAPGQYVVEVTDSTLCKTNDTIQIYQYTHPPVLLNNDTNVCSGVSVVVSPSGAPYVSYIWSNTLTTPTITVNTAGNYTVTVNDGNCDYVSDVFTLSNHQTTAPPAFSDTTVCAGEPVTLTSQTGLSNYGWSNGVPGTQITVTNAGTYSYTATDNNGCSVTSTNVVVTHTSLPVPNIVANPAAICLGQGGSTLNAGSETGVTYTWTPGGSGNTIQVTTPGFYSVVAVRNGCFGYDTLEVFASDTPLLNLPPLVKTCCQSVTLDPAPGLNYTFQWSDNSTGATLAITSTNNTTATYAVTATNSAACTAADQTTVQIKCIEAAAIAVPDTIMFGDSSQLNVSTAYQGNFGYVWSPSTGLSNNGVADPKAAPDQNLTYTVIVTDIDDQCVDTAQIAIVVLSPGIAIPNAFTPNGDGRNDLFYPVNIMGDKTIQTFRVYNRWGAVVHDSLSGWDGKFDGKDQPAGTFLYYMVVRGLSTTNPGTYEDKPYTGSFTLIR